MKQIVDIIKGTVLIAIALTILSLALNKAQAEEMKSDLFNETFDTTKEVTLFCGDYKKVAYYMGYTFQLIPMSFGVHYDLFEDEAYNIIFAASPDARTLGMFIIDDSTGKLCVSNISINNTRLSSMGETTHIHLDDNCTDDGCPSFYKD